ncbi:MAG TPA: molybdopterin-dependent oxidoreductase, partial [Candidatus Thermoplasmatota archaeon]|nr:molybdopterin-dependent oxidoreductase [Candidatus Thermoplasmatota archaeon]
MGGLARSFETGAILGALTLLLAATGLAISPTLVSAQSNALYVAHVVLGLLLVVALAAHLVPLARRAFRRIDSSALLVLVVVEVLTGLALWRHVYVPLPKAAAVFAHLALTAPLLAPLATHAVRGTRAWWANRQAARALVARQPPDAAWRAEASLARRAFLRVGAYAVAGFALAWTFGRAATAELTEWRVNSIGRTPILSKEDWRLKVTGLVERPVTLTYAQLLAMRQVELRFTHHCVE